LGASGSPFIAFEDPFVRPGAFEDRFGRPGGALGVCAAFVCRAGLAVFGFVDRGEAFGAVFETWPSTLAAGAGG